MNDWTVLALKGLDLAFDNDGQLDYKKSKIEVEQAKKYFYESLQKEPSEAWPYIKYAELLDDESEKIKIYEKAYNTEPNIYSCLKLIDLYLNFLDFSKAKEWLNNLIIVDNNNASIKKYTNLLNLVNNLPKDFNPEFYLKTHNELFLTSKLDAIIHYLKFGHKEFRQYKSSIDIPFKEKEQQEIILFTQYYQCDENRKNEIQYCLKQNLNNGSIDKLVVFCEKSCSKELNDFYNLHFSENKKLLIVPIDDRLTYKQWFNYSYDNYPKSIKILANSDIYFDETIKILYELDYKNNILYSCSRIDLSPTGELVQSTVDKSPGSLPINNSRCHDCWIFKHSLLDFDHDLVVGYENCDILLKIRSEKAGCNFLNLCEHMRCIHVDNREKKVRSKYNLSNLQISSPEETRVFIVTPCYNMVETIDRTILSVISQAGDFIIHYHIQDGGSTDGTVEILEQWKKRIETNFFPTMCKKINFSYSSTKDEGMYDAIYRGFDSFDAEYNDSDWMTWINADDILSHGACAFIAEIDKQMLDEIRWVTNGIIAIENDNILVYQEDRVINRDIIKNGLSDGIHFDFVQQEGTFFRNSLWKLIDAEQNFRNFKYAGDWNLWRCFAQETDPYTTNFSLGRFSLREKQISRDKISEYNDEINNILSINTRSKNMQMLQELKRITQLCIINSLFTKKEFCIKEIDVTESVNNKKTSLSMQEKTESTSLFKDFSTDTQRPSEGVSLVTCCMNRSENLLKSLRTWLEHTEISQIIIVDWASEVPVRDTIIRAGIHDYRILVVRVNNQSSWILSRAFNLGFRFADYDKILKTDADVMIKPNFFEQNPLLPGTFVSGDWRLADKGQEHINGFFYVRRQDLFNVNGFNEYITTYGWDDDDLYNRLMQEDALSRVRIKAGSVYHIPHEDSQRGSSQDAANALEEAKQHLYTKIIANRHISSMFSWNKYKQLYPFSFNYYEKGYVEIETKKDAHVVLTGHPSISEIIPPHIQADVEYYAIAELVSHKTETSSAFSIPKHLLYKLLISRKSLSDLTIADTRLCAYGATDEIDWHRNTILVYFTSDVTPDQKVRITEEIYKLACELNFTILVDKITFKKVAFQKNEDHRIKRILPVPDIFPTNSIPVSSSTFLEDPKKTLNSNPVNIINLDSKSIDKFFQRSHNQNTAITFKKRDRIYIHVQHGLGNRLRAMASAMVLAEATSRELVLIWAPDHHCDCEFRDLFNYDGNVVNNLNDIDIRSAYYFNYMSIEPNSHKDKYISLVPGQDVYIKSAYSLNNKNISWDQENIALRSLQVSDAVKDLLKSIQSNFDIGVHIRMEGRPGTDQNSHDSAKNWTKDEHEKINYWREKSHYINFMKRIDKLIKQKPDSNIFLAADTSEAYNAFYSKYNNNNLVFLTRNHFNRSKENLIYALADAILLSRCEYLLGSTWSSFTELAQRLANKNQKVEMSGVDF